MLTEGYRPDGLLKFLLDFNIDFESWGQPLNYSENISI